MFVYVHVNTRTAAASEGRLMQVCCEKCGGIYRYRMVRRGVGKASTVYNIDLPGTAQRAARNAQKVLHRLLQKGIDPVPCPHCGWWQWHMVEEIHRRQFSWIGRLGWILFFVFVPFWIIDVCLMFTSEEPITPGARVF